MRDSNYNIQWFDNDAMSKIVALVRKIFKIPKKSLLTNLYYFSLFDLCKRVILLKKFFSKLIIFQLKEGRI